MVVDGYFLAGPVVIIQFALGKYNGVCKAGTFGTGKYYFAGCIADVLITPFLL